MNVMIHIKKIHGYLLFYLLKVLIRLLLGHEIFVRVDKDYLLDGFNHYGLGKYIPNITEITNLMISIEFKRNQSINSQMLRLLKKAYGLIHQRYIETPSGMRQILHHYENEIFENCPRVYCENYPMLPFGQSNEFNIAKLAFYCPRCQDFYAPQKSQYKSIDGAYFGSHFVHILLLTYPQMVVNKKVPFVGKLFGFKMHESSINHPPKVIYDNPTNKMNIIPKPMPVFIDSNTVVKMPRKFIIDIDPANKMIK